MRMYIISETEVTLPKYSIDGKAHRHKLYFAGVKNLGGFAFLSWERGKKSAQRFTKRQANSWAKHFQDRGEKVVISEEV